MNASAESVDASGARSFLPDFCSIRTLLVVLIVAELLAMVLVLGAPAPWDLFWQELGVRSLFIQWVALASVASLCWSRPWLGRLDDRGAGLLSYGIVLAVTVLVSAVALWGGRAVGLDPAGGDALAYVLRHLGVSAVVGAVLLRFLYLGHQQRALVQAQAEARIEALQARIRPHFLFNSMNTIAALIRSRPQRAEAAVEDLADLFRASLSEARGLVPLHQELDMARRYMALEGLRLGERLRVHWDLDQVPGDVLLPPLVLQPLLENAIYHGVEQLPGGGVIGVHGRLTGERLYLQVTNPVPPRSEPAYRGNRMALDNIRERLGLACGRGAGVAVKLEAQCCRVTLTLPRGEAP